MFFVSTNTIREIDRYVIEDIGIPGEVLMERAGVQSAKVILSFYKQECKGRVAIVVGKGNNGGDGLVIAREFINHGIDADVFLLAPPEDFKGEARKNLEILLKIIQNKEETGGIIVVNENNIDAISEALEYEYTLIIDAIFGTGLNGPPKGLSQKIIDVINRCMVPVVAVDIPSGINGRTGEIPGSAVMAHITITMGLPKLELTLPHILQYTGKIIGVNIGFPMELIGDRMEEDVWFPIQKMAFSFLHLLPTPPASHKGTYGKLLVVAGSKGMTGAAILTSKASLRSGAGLTYLALPESCIPLVAPAIPEVVTIPCPETPEGTFSKEAVDTILNAISELSPSAIVIGPGIKHTKELSYFVNTILPNIPEHIPIVIDADGINNLSLKTLEHTEAPVILTPHPGEFSRLTNTPIDTVLKKKFASAEEFVRKYPSALHIKGIPGVVCVSSHKDVILRSTHIIDIPCIATAGSGDVLSGILGGLLARAEKPIETTMLYNLLNAGILTHLASGFLASKNMNIKPHQRGLLAGELLEYIPQVINSGGDIDLPSDFESGGIGWIE